MRKLASERRGEISLRLQVGEIRRVSLRAKPERGKKARESIREGRKDLVTQSEEERRVKHNIILMSVEQLHGRRKERGREKGEREKV